MAKLNQSIPDAVGTVQPRQVSSADTATRRRIGRSERRAHREVYRLLLPLVMEHTRGNQFQAAKVLGVARQTLGRRLRELQIAPRFTDETEADPD